MSLKRIAELTGTSPATVSRVLNHADYHCQDPLLTEKIRQTARDLGYIPNQSARDLKLGSTYSKQTGSYVIDILLARFDSLDKDPFFAELFRCIETNFHKMNCSIGNIRNVPDIAFITSKQAPLKADGLIILGKCPGELADELIRTYPAAIAIDRNPTEYKMDEVVCNGSLAASMAVEYLIRLGHTHIAYIGDCNTESRYMGYYEALQAHKLPLTYDSIIPTNQTKEDGYRAFYEILSKPQRPSAVFCANDITALGFLSAMQESNGRKKKQAYRPAVISIDDIEEASHVTPLLSTVRIPKEDMAHLAILTLLDRLNKGHRENIRLELPCQLIVRESSGPCLN